MKEKIMAFGIIIGIIMTAFPPQKVQTYQILRSDRSSKLVDEAIEYRFIGGERRFDPNFFEQTSIAFDRLLLQYLILAGSSFAFYLLFLAKKKKEESGV